MGKHCKTFSITSTAERAQLIYRHESCPETLATKNLSSKWDSNPRSRSLDHPANGPPHLAFVLPWVFTCKCFSWALDRLTWQYMRKALIGFLVPSPDFPFPDFLLPPDPEDIPAWSADVGSADSSPAASSSSTGKNVSWQWGRMINFMSVYH